ncbi:putative FAM91 N terminus FAM91 C terminus [Trypanosoma vivax]|nr:putative FAM91 N terminus FAM91 C terminus [Trypanosoma vivax]
MSAQHQKTELERALEDSAPYDTLSIGLQQQYTPGNYRQQAIHHAAMRYRSYRSLPDFIHSAVSEESYYVAMVQCLQKKLQVYPYPHIEAVTRHTRETPLSYYTAMVAELLKKECSYDTLPNFTAVDVLNCLAIGRNQYLDLLKEVKGTYRWFLHKGHVKEHLPAEMVQGVELMPFWQVVAVDVPSDVLKRAALPTEVTELYRRIRKGRPGDADRKHGSTSSILSYVVNGGKSDDSGSGGSSSGNNLTHGRFESNRRHLRCPLYYACELPKDSLHELYRKGLVCVAFSVRVEDQVVVPPLKSFVMNRASEEPVEVLMYKVLGAIDNRTPLSLLAQLLMVKEADVLLAIHMCLRLRLVQLRDVPIPPYIAQHTDCVHESWGAVLCSPVSGGSTQGKNAICFGNDDKINRSNTDCNARGTADGSAPQLQNAAGSEVGPCGDSNDDVNPSGDVLPSFVKSCTTCGVGTSDASHPSRRIALLYDGSLTGFLMMTNLSTDPEFKQNAVTLFEVGKLQDEAMPNFIEKLDQVDKQVAASFVGEAANYVQRVLSLREVLKALRRIPGADGECGVDMIKVESINQQEASTRYSLLVRNYWAYVVIHPISQAPLVDIELNGVYGSTVTVMPSPWLMLFLYEKMKRGPPSLLLPVGTPIFAWPPMLQETKRRCVVKLRLQPLTTDAEVSYMESATSIIFASEMTAKAPLFVQRVAEVPLEAAVPPTSNAAGVLTSIQNSSEEWMDGFGGDEWSAKDVLIESPFYVGVEVVVPFSASGVEATELLRMAVQRHTKVASVRFASSNRNNSNDGNDVASSSGNSNSKSYNNATNNSGFVPEPVDPQGGEHNNITRTTCGSGEGSDVGSCVDLPVQFVEYFCATVAALHVQDSLGSVTFYVSLREQQPPVQDGTTPCHAQNGALGSDAVHASDEAQELGDTRTYCVVDVLAIDVGLGVDLLSESCCSLMVRHMESLMEEARSESHNQAMRLLSSEFGEFLGRYTTLQPTDKNKLALKSTATTPDSAQQHLRRLGEWGNGGIPLPSTMMLFDGSCMKCIDDWDPLVELWDV